MTPSSRPGIRFTPQRVRATGGVGPGRALSPAPAGLRHDSSSWHIPLSAIEPDPHQPRRTFDQDPLQSLADSIAEGGLRMPITVRRVAEGEDRFIIVTGERRWRASQLAGLDTIRAFIKEVEEATVVGVVAEQIDENSQREPLTIIETGRGLRRLRHEMAHATGSDPNALDEEDDADDGAAGGGARMTTRARAYSWRSVARQAHMPYATAMRSVYATRYPDVVAAVEDRTISGAVAVEIAQVRDSDERAGLLERARAEHLSAPQVARIRDGQPLTTVTSVTVDESEDAATGRAEDRERPRLTDPPVDASRAAAAEGVPDGGRARPAANGHAMPESVDAATDDKGTGARAWPGTHTGATLNVGAATAPQGWDPFSVAAASSAGQTAAALGAIPAALAACGGPARMLIFLDAALAGGYGDLTALRVAVADGQLDVDTL